METTQSSTSKVGQAGFMPIPNLDKMVVGHAGLYEPDDGIVDSEAELVVADIPLGLKGGKTLIDCEKGIKAFVKDVCAKDRNNHLPNSELGVWVHYLTEGIARDFNRTWTEPPISIRQKDTPVEKARKEGKRTLSKGQKNLMLDKLSYTYYEEDVNAGRITQQDAFACMAEAAAQKKELEDAGFFINPNRTQGVSLFDWKSIVRASHEDEKATRVYTKYKVEVIIPNIVENFYQSLEKPEKLKKELIKSPLLETYGVAELVEEKDGHLEIEKTSIKTDEDLYNYLKSYTAGESLFKEIDGKYSIKGFHLIKMAQPGMMKPRWVCIDCVSIKDGTQRLFFIGRHGATAKLQLDKPDSIIFDERQTLSNG